MKYVVLMGHDADARKDVKAFDTYAEAATCAHAFFESYGFTVRDGVPCSEDGDPIAEDFDDFKVVDGKVVAFMHAGGDGPVCEIREG